MREHIELPALHHQPLAAERDRGVGEVELLEEAAMDAVGKTVAAERQQRIEGEAGKRRRHGFPKRIRAGGAAGPC